MYFYKQNNVILVVVVTAYVHHNFKMYILNI